MTEVDVRTDVRGRNTGHVKVPVSIADLKLLKQLTTLGVKKENAYSGMNMLHFVIDKDAWFAWATDSYVLGITEFIRQDSSYVRFNVEDDRTIDTPHRIYAAVKITDFNKMVTDISKWYKPNEIDEHTYLTFIGNQSVKWVNRDDREESHFTCMLVGLEMEYSAPYELLNHADKLRTSIGVFNDFWNDQEGSIGPDRRRPITNMQWSPTHLKRVMNFLTFNNDDHVTYMYNYDGKYGHAAFYNKTCSGKDSATNKFAWIMPQHCELENE
jgi:hypothetical protein